jgi:hypothetical protein
MSNKKPIYDNGYKPSEKIEKGYQPTKNHASNAQNGYQPVKQQISNPKPPSKE